MKHTPEIASNGPRPAVFSLGQAFSAAQYANRKPTRLDYFRESPAGRRAIVERWQVLAADLPEIENVYEGPHAIAMTLCDRLWGFYTPPALPAPDYLDGDYQRIGSRVASEWGE